MNDKVEIHQLSCRCCNKKYWQQKPHDNDEDPYLDPSEASRYQLFDS